VTAASRRGDTCAQHRVCETLEQAKVEACEKLGDDKGFIIGGDHAAEG
jgi:hypothetical protein